MSLAYKLISLWFLASSLVVFWDAMYCFMRPESMTGGKLHWLWKPYGLYQTVDYLYGIPAYESRNGFTNAQALLNMVEVALNLLYVYLANVVESPGAPVVGFASVVMTLSKTVLYLAQEYFCNFCETRQNSWSRWILLYLIPNGFWILVPSIVVSKFASDISANLRANAKKRSDTKTM